MTLVNPVDGRLNPVDGRPVMFVGERKYVLPSVSTAESSASSESSELKERMQRIVAKALPPYEDSLNEAQMACRGKISEIRKAALGCSPTMQRVVLGAIRAGQHGFVQKFFKEVCKTRTGDGIHGCFARDRQIGWNNWLQRNLECAGEKEVVKQLGQGSTYPLKKPDILTLNEEFGTEITARIEEINPSKTLGITRFSKDSWKELTAWSSKLSDALFTGKINYTDEKVQNLIKRFITAIVSKRVTWDTLLQSMQISVVTKAQQCAHAAGVPELAAQIGKIVRENGSKDVQDKIEQLSNHDYEFAPFIKSLNNSGIKDASSQIQALIEERASNVDELRRKKFIDAETAQEELSKIAVTCLKIGNDDLYEEVKGMLDKRPGLMAIFLNTVASRI